MSRGGMDGVRRRNLHAADPRCWYCGVVTWEPGMGLGSEEADPWTRSTLEHCFARARRARYLTGRGRPVPGATVLACWSCNDNRNRYGILLRRAEGR